MYLLDTSVVSEMAKRPKYNPNVGRWLEQVTSDSLFVSVLLIGELRDGIERIRPRNVNRATALEHWFEELLSVFVDRLLPIDTAVAQRWGRMNARYRLPIVDSLMAATAAVHGFTFVTRNIRDFARTGVSCINPFETNSQL